MRSQTRLIESEVLIWARYPRQRHPQQNSGRRTGHYATIVTRGFLKATPPLLSKAKLFPGCQFACGDLSMQPDSKLPRKPLARIQVELGW
jgi:hypothetical protein